MNYGVLIAIGTNIPGPWGGNVETAEKAIAALQSRGLQVVSRSRLFQTAPLGSGRQSPYVNGVICVATYLPPMALLGLLKKIERQAGRRGGRPWGPRTLDLDILDYKGIIRNWDARHQTPKSTRKGGLILPHALLHTRPFVLVPLLEACPRWRHPVLLKSVPDLMRGVKQSDPGQILNPVK